MARGLVAEGRNAVGEIQVVVDGFGNVHHPKFPWMLLVQAHGSEGGSVATDRDQVTDPQRFQSAANLLQVLRVFGGIGSIDANEGPTLKRERCDVFDGQRDDVFRVRCHQPFEPVSDPDNFPAVEPRTDRRRCDHAVDAWGRATRSENTEPAFGCHGVAGAETSRSDCSRSVAGHASCGSVGTELRLGPESASRSKMAGSGHLPVLWAAKQRTR